MSKPLWTWSGDFFGFRSDDDLWTYDGRHVGRFDGDEVYSPEGAYLGEIRSGRLIRNTGKDNKRRSAFAVKASRMGSIPYVNYVGNVGVLGYDDFPPPERF